MSRFSFLSACLLLCASVSAREWTAMDGRKLQAEFVSATDTTVTLKLANCQTRTLPLARLSSLIPVRRQRRTACQHRGFDPCRGRMGLLAYQGCSLVPRLTPG